MTSTTQLGARRARLKQALGSGLLILPCGYEQERQGDTLGYYPSRYGFANWRPDSDFYYLTGFAEPQSVLLISDEAEYLFCLPHDERHELWFGERAGPEGAAAISGITDVRPIAELEQCLRQLLPGQACVQFPYGADWAFDRCILGLLNSINTPRNIRQGLQCPPSLQDPRPLLHEMRKIKDDQELALLREGLAINRAAMLRAMRATRAGRFEFEIEAEILHEYRRHGCRAPAYNPIVGGGRNACILHYTDNRSALQDGDMLLIDSGCEWHYYNCDITRSFPVNGRFSAFQQDLYQLVLAAERAGIAAMRPGVAVDQPHAACVRVVSQGLIDLGLCHGSLDGVIESGSYQRYFMHGSGHWLGLDTHDVGRVSHQGQPERYQPGMVSTIEPGIYIRPADDVPPAMWHTGIRIEDNVLLTDSGNEVLSQDIPVEIADIEAAMRG